MFFPFKSPISFIPVSGLTKIASVPIASITPIDIIGAPLDARLTNAPHDPYAKSLSPLATSL